jgi:beta-galactosidase
MNFHIKGNNFYLDNKKIFLNSGEIHYFRIRRELWSKHLEAAKNAGLMAVSSYVPWAWHEETEGTFDFDGNTSPEKDLAGWINLCKKLGLYCILKPGPFILAEFRGAGLPDWFLDQYAAQVKMHNSKGEIVQSDGVSLFNPLFLENVTRWYDTIMPFIAERELKSGGPVIMMQICNEIGVFAWLAHQGDYCRIVQERFQAYLSEKFKEIGILNELWGTGYHDFTEISLPPDGRIPYASREDRGRDHEWHLFWRRYYGDYLRMMSGMARERGITVPLYHNLPGWIYGHGYEFPVNITMYEDLYGEKSDIIFGVDHIPEFFSYRNMHDDRIINDIVNAMLGNKPLFAAEFQCGSREYQVVTNPRELELFYKASIADGLTGWNYYMFSQGKNPPRKGYSGDTFYWFTPLTADGELTSHYPLVKHMNRIVKTSEGIIVDARRKAEVCVLFYPPYYATELERPEEGRSGITFNPSGIRRAAYFDGLLKVLQILDVDYDMFDLTKTTLEELSVYKQVWSFCCDEMNEADQQTLADHLADGGNIIVFPYLPDREMSQKPCTILRDGISVSPSGKEVVDSPLVNILGLRDIKCSNPQIIYSADSLSGAEIIATTITGKPCGFIKILGKGTLIHLGTWIGFETEGHLPVYEALLSRSGAKLRNASSSNRFINVRQRFTQGGSALLFIGNYYNEEQSAKITYTHPGTNESISIPYSQEEFRWPPVYGVLTPICLDIAEGIKILHTTSDILDIIKSKDQIEITLFGDRDLNGELILEGTNISGVKSVTVNNKMIKILQLDKRLILNYKHLHNQESTMKLLFINNL